MSTMAGLPPLYHRHVYTGIKESLISSFPTEILLLIFNELYATSGTFDPSDKHDMCVRRFQMSKDILAPELYLECNCTKEEKESIFSWDTPAEEEISEVLFPYAIAQVSRRWLFILESRPEFWTRIIVFLDAQPHPDDTPLPTLARQLELSRGHILQEFYVKRNSYSNHDPYEYERCRVIIESLIPHVYRCHFISFHTLVRSSLPSVGQDFHGSAPILEGLTLNARIDDGHSTNRDSKYESDPEFVCPKISDVCIDHQNFVNWCLNSSLRASLSVRTDLVSRIIKIALSNFAPTSTDFTLNNLMWCLGGLPCLYSLEFDNCMFKSDDKLSAEVHPPSIKAQELHLRNLSAPYMNAIYNMEFSTLEFLYVDNCQLSDRETQAQILPTAQTVELMDIEPTPTADGLDNMAMARFLSGWMGFTLAVTNCPSFNDEALDVLKRILHTELQLYLIDCDGWTVEGLRRMLFRLRTTSAEIHDVEGSVSDIDISGWGPPKPNEEQMEWFQSNVSHTFIWEAEERNSAE